VLDLLDAGLERGDLPLQLGEVTIENLSAAALAGQPRLDPSQSLGDRLLLLLEPLESAVDLVEVPEHVLTQLGDPAFQRVEATVDRGELATQEFDQLRVFGRGHGLCLSCLVIRFKCIHGQTMKWAPIEHRSP
jgi:hypothetical protein